MAVKVICDICGGDAEKDEFILPVRKREDVDLIDEFERSTLR